MSVCAVTTGLLRGGGARAIIAPVKTPPFLLAAALFSQGCIDAPGALDVTIELVNPTDFTFEGSGGALGAGVEIRAAGLEDGQELIVDDTCMGRHCGEYAETEPGRCGLDPRTIDPQQSIRLAWDGRFFPRSADLYGECLAAARTVEDGTVTITLCGRLRGGDIRNAQLVCQDHPVTVERNLESVFSFTVPGVREGSGS